MNYYLSLFLVFQIILENCFVNCDFKSDIIDYYNSEAVSSFRKQWETHRRSYENALKMALRESFGKKGMNTIERKTDNAFLLSEGFYMTDNVVHVIFKNLILSELPHLKELEATFQLADNVLLVEAELSKMIVEAKYNLMRNSSDLVFTGTVQDPYKNSPFVMQQVQNKGNAAIIVEGCSLNGFTISTLTGQIIALGHDTIRIKNCKFSVEISSLGIGSPPIIAPYFSNEQRTLLENLINKPIRMELMTKLQSTMFSLLNTSIFDKDLFKYRKNQEKIFNESRYYIDQIIRNANKDAIIGNKASEDLAPLEILRNGNNQSKTKTELVILSDLVVDGFDSAYSPHIGGPYRLRTVGIAETLRYNTLKVRGQLISERDKVRRERGFFVELQDVSVNLEMNLENESPDKFNTDVYIYWRNTDFSIINMKHVRDRVTAESIISGHLINQLPKCLVQRLLKLTDSEISVKSEEAPYKKERDNGDLVSNGSENELAKHEEADNSSSGGIENVQVKIHLPMSHSYDVESKDELTLESKDKMEVQDEDETEKENKELKPQKSIGINEDFMSQSDIEEADNSSTNSQEGRRRHKKKHTKHNRNGKHHHKRRHRERGGKTNRHIIESVNRKRLKPKFTQMPIYISDNEV